MQNNYNVPYNQSVPKIKKRKAIFIIAIIFTIISAVILGGYLYLTGGISGIFSHQNGIVVLTGIFIYLIFLGVAIIGFPLSLISLLCSLVATGSKIKGIKITSIILVLFNIAQLIAYILSISDVVDLLKNK